MNKYYSHIIRFVVLILLQVLVFSNVRMFGYYNPYIYLIFLLLLPVHIENWLLLVLGFVAGISIDIFNSVLGIHAAACVLACAVRPLIIGNMFNLKEIKVGTYPQIYWYGIGGFVLYAFIFVLIHHLVLFFLDVFTFQRFYMTLWHSLINTLITCAFVMGDQVVFHSKARKK